MHIPILAYLLENRLKPYSITSWQNIVYKKQFVLNTKKSFAILSQIQFAISAFFNVLNAIKLYNSASAIYFCFSLAQVEKMEIMTLLCCALYCFFVVVSRFHFG